MTRLVVTVDAEADTSGILDYLERAAGRRVAEDYGRRFQQAIEQLADLPEAGPPRSALGGGVRIGIVSPYIIIYDYNRDDDTVTLLRIVHGRRNITRGLLHRS
jgi:toxin ParE1/3/4